MGGREFIVKQWVWSEIMVKYMLDYLVVNGDNKKTAGRCYYAKAYNE